jgi:biotin carboxylase
LKKALLVLGAGQDQLFMIQTCKEMGYISVCVDGNPNAPGLKKADYSKAISFTEVEDVILYCKNLIKQGVNLSGVSTMGSDIPHILHKLASHFNWVGPSLETSRWASHKFKMKNHFADKNIPIPRFGLVKNIKDIEDLRKIWGVDKLIIKPTDRAGSRGVLMISMNDDLNFALDYAKKYSFNNEIILEEFISGPQISTETIMLNGSAITPGFADRNYDDTKNFYPIIIENGGWVPSNLSKDLRQNVCLLVESAAKALGITNGVAKGDVVICPIRGPLIIEMAARLSGGDFSESLVPMSTGINYVRTVIEISISKKPDLNKLSAQKNKVVANRYFFLPSGNLSDIKGIEKIKEIPQLKKFELYVKPKDILPKIESHNKRAGVFVVVGDDRTSVENIIDYIYNTINFKVNGVFVTGNPKDYYG